MILKRKGLSVLSLSLIVWFFLFSSINAYADRLVSIKKTQHHENLWDRVRNGFALALPPDNKTIRKLEAPYTQNPRAFNHIAVSSERYLFYIVDEIERRNMPMEIALIPVIESSYNPLIKSDNRSAGLWQFIPETARIFGLTQNVWHDDRRDVVASTQAALDYLQYLYQKFDNWKLAIAAYNIGEGVVSKALARNIHKGRSVNFYDLNLPIEAKHYVFKLLVIKDIIANSRKYGIQLQPIPNRPYFEEVKIHEHIDISLVTRLANISDIEFSALNPAYNRFVIKVLDEPRTLLLPKDRKETFVKNLEMYQDPRFSWQIYHVKKGEKINDIAIRHETTVKQLQAINGIARNKNLTFGQKILVPQLIGANKLTMIAQNEKQFQGDKSGVHIVKKGDTLYHIAKRYRTTIDQIKQWNNSDENLSIGQKLFIVKS
ncbi:MAG: transglycosylase SLT domain-containing protein [Nitrosomonas sp.]|nr:transglycosylase SLT domain-containing protein [Nitrosomonas sp.]